MRTAPGAEVGAVFAALADERRRQILLAIGAAPERTQKELAAALPITRQAVAKHLSQLSQAGLVRRRPSGRTVRYELSDEGLGAAMTWIASVGAGWDERLARLRRQLETRASPSPPSS